MMFRVISLKFLAKKIPKTKKSIAKRRVRVFRVVIV